MADTKDTHHNVVDIPSNEENQKPISISTIQQHHPLMEISQSPGHLLLLKLWQREENIFTKKIITKESQLDSIKKELFQLCSFFFLFHFLFLTILFSSSIQDEDDHHHRCKKWWIPSILSTVTSLVIVSLVHVKLCRFWKGSAELQREKSDNRALTRCIQELRMKGVGFDLNKEPHIGKRMKSSSVVVKLQPISWFFRYVVTVSLVCFAGLVFPASRLILCI